MLHITAISGSLRRHSYNTALLKTIISLKPDHCQIQLVTLEDIPLYNQDDEESSGIPEAVESLKNKIAKSKGLLLATPEYNHSIPGVMKNTLDWLTRPSSDIPKVFGNKITGLIGCTVGSMGTLSAQTAWLPIFRALGMSPWFGKKLFLSKIQDTLDDNGQITDEKTKTKLQEYINRFVQHIQEHT